MLSFVISIRRLPRPSKGTFSPPASRGARPNNLTAGARPEGHFVHVVTIIWYHALVTRLRLGPLRPVHATPRGKMDIRPLHTDDDYRPALADVSALVDRNLEPGSPEGDCLEVLAARMEYYEAEHF